MKKQSKPRKRTRAVDEHGYPLQPQRLNENLWFYEEVDGVRVYISCKRLNGELVSIRLPWWRLEKAVQRRHEAQAFKAGAIRPPS